VGTWNIDVATGQHQWTGEVYRLFGLEPGSVEPSNEVLQRYMNPDDRARLVEAVRAAELGDGRCEVQVRTVGADGIARTLWIRSEIVRDDQGRACRWEGATQDVTDLVRAQESLAERERFLRSTLEAIQSGILVLDASPDARIISANKQASEIFGYSPAELVGRRTADLVIEEQRRLIEERREARLGGELGIAGFQLRGRRKDGALIDLESRGAPLVHKGELEGVVVDVRDVTDEVALQREVQSNAERLNTVFETVSTGLLVIGADLRPITANRSACEILGYDQVELMEKTVADLGDPVGAKMLVDEVTKRIQRGSKMSFLQAKIRRGDGIWIDAELTVEPFRVDGSLVGALCEIRDVTEKRAAERELRQLNSDAEARSRERQALVQQLLTAQEEERRTVAYDIHDGPAQQLAAAQMFLETYAHEADVDLESDAAEHLRRAKLYLETGLGETRRIMSGLRPSQLDDLGLVDAIGQLLAELTAGAAVECEFKATRLSAVIPAEVEITLFRIVQEAIGNALKYSGTDRVEVDLSAGAETVKLHVRDWGSGFDPSAIEGPRDGRRYGLVGMRERVALLGGRFTIDSRRGEGTTISAEIPLG